MTNQSKQQPTGSQPNLNEEIILLRAMIRRVFNETSEQAITLRQWVGALNALGMASSRLARLIKLQETRAARGANDKQGALEHILADAIGGAAHDISRSQQA